MLPGINEAVARQILAAQDTRWHTVIGSTIRSRSLLRTERKGNLLMATDAYLYLSAARIRDVQIGMPCACAGHRVKLRRSREVGFAPIAKGVRPDSEPPPSVKSN
jgi:hypothetical protein